jgi:hypothetical protein
VDRQPDPELASAEKPEYSTQRRFTHSFFPLGELENANAGIVSITSRKPPVVNVGISANNVLAVDAPPQFIQALLTARLRSELQKSSLGKVSDRQIGRDLQLLQRAMEEDASLEAFLASRP